MERMNLLKIFAVALIACVATIAAHAQITYEVQIDFPMANTVVQDIDLPVKGAVKRVGIGPNKPGAAFIEVTATVAGEVETTRTDKNGNYEFRFYPEEGVPCTVEVEAFGGLYKNSVSGIIPMKEFGGMFDPRALYFDLDRQDMIKSHIVARQKQLKFTMTRITTYDASFNWEDNGNRQFPDPHEGTFPWTAGDPGDYSAATNNHAGEALNNKFFNRLKRFCKNFNDAGIKVILTVFDPWYYSKGEATVSQNDPWAKLALQHGMAWDSHLHVFPDDGTPMADAMEAYLLKLADTFYTMGEDVYVEFNNETQYLHGTGEPTPSNAWLKEWQDFFFKALRDEATGSHSVLSVHLMVNAQNGDVTGDQVNDYTGECWCHWDSPYNLDDVLIRNMYVSGHRLTSASSISFELCQFTPGSCGNRNLRGTFFTEGEANQTTRDDYVFYALENGYDVALGTNQRYRTLAPWGFANNTEQSCNEVNDAISQAVTEANATP